MSISYPRKQTVVIAVVCLIAVVAAAHYAHIGTGTASAQQDDRDGSAVTVDASSVGVGLPAADTASSTGSDWRKQFTDAALTGTYKVAAGSAGSSGKTEPLSMTDQLSRELFTRYMELKQANLLDDQTAVDQTASDLVEQNVSSVQSKAYSAKDIAIAPASDHASLSAFASAVEHAVELYDAKESESTIMNDYMSSNDPSVLARIDPITATYKRMLAGLLAIPTPLSMSTYEISLINSVSTLEFAAESLRATDKDTVRGIAGVSAHVSGIDQLTSSLLSMQSALGQQGVPFVLNDQDAFNILLN